MCEHNVQVLFEVLRPIAYVLDCTTVGISCPGEVSGIGRVLDHADTLTMAQVEQYCLLCNEGYADEATLHAEKLVEQGYIAFHGFIAYGDTVDKYVLLNDLEGTPDD